MEKKILVELTQEQLRLIVGMCHLSLHDATQSVLQPQSMEEALAAMLIGPKIIDLVEHLEPLIEKAPSVGSN